jgi:cellobiose-specific phosphotransferase system component IIC
MSVLILTWLWDNKRLIGEILAIIAVCSLLWFYTIHNPKVIKQLETEKAELTRQVINRDAAINLLTSIEAAHDTITKTSYKNISSIRYTPKPGRTGLFYGAGGMP